MSGSLPTSYRVRDLLVSPAVVLAPMEGVTDLTFRRVIRSIGGVVLTRGVRGVRIVLVLVGEGALARTKDTFFGSVTRAHNKEIVEEIGSVTVHLRGKAER